MKIRWDEEAIMEGTEHVSHALIAIDNCLNRSAETRELLLEACPSQDAQAFNRLIDQYNEVVSRLHRRQARIENIKRGMDAAREAFEEAENTVGRLIQRLGIATVDDQVRTEVHYQDRSTSVSETSAGEVNIPEPIVLPRKYNRKQIVMDWLEPILNDDSRFGQWT